MKTSVKKIGLLFIATVISSFALSCSSSDDGGGGGGSAAPGTISAKVDGANFESSTMTTIGTKILVNGTAHMITLYGTEMNMTSGASKNINIIMNVPDLEPRSYDIGGDNLTGFVATYTEASGTVGSVTSSTWAAPYEGGELAGKITITEITETGIKGTFNFKGQKQDSSGGDWVNDFKNITNGAFDVEFSQF